MLSHKRTPSRGKSAVSNGMDTKKRRSLSRGYFWEVFPHRKTGGKKKTVAPWAEERWLERGGKEVGQKGQGGEGFRGCDKGGNVVQFKKKNRIL